jgi:hypothetical protein
VSSLVCALHSRSSLNIFFLWCCLLFRCIRFASDSANGEFVFVLLYMLYSLSSRLFSMVHMVVMSGLCMAVCVYFVGCCVRSYPLVDWVSRSGFMGVVENVRLGDLHPSLVPGFSGVVRLFVFLADWDLCL